MKKLYERIILISFSIDLLFIIFCGISKKKKGLKPSILRYIDSLSIVLPKTLITYYYLTSTFY